MSEIDLLKSKVSKLEKELKSLTNTNGSKNIILNSLDGTNTGNLEDEDIILFYDKSDNKTKYAKKSQVSSGGSGGGSSTYKGLTGIIAVNSDTSANETLDGDHRFLHFGTLQIDHEVTISSGKTLEFIRLGGK